MECLWVKPTVALQSVIYISVCALCCPCLSPKRLFFLVRQEMFSEVVRCVLCFRGFPCSAHLKYIAACNAIWMQHLIDSWGDIWFVDINAVTFQYCDFCFHFLCVPFAANCSVVPFEVNSRHWQKQSLPYRTTSIWFWWVNCSYLTRLPFSASELLN